MKNDWLNLLEIVDYDHKYFGSKSDIHSHMDTCILIMVIQRIIYFIKYQIYS